MQAVRDTASSYQLAVLLEKAHAVVVQRFTVPPFLKSFYAGVIAAASEDNEHSSGATGVALEKPTNTNPTKKTNIMDTLVMALVNALLAIAAAINNLAAAQGGSAPTNIVAGPGATAETPAASKPAAAAKTGGGGNADALAKARAAAAAKREAEAKAKAEAAASEQADLDLLGGGGEAPAGAVTLEMLRAKGMEILKAKKQPEMKELLTSLGAGSLTALTEDKYQEAYDGLEAILSL